MQRYSLAWSLYRGEETTQWTDLYGGATSNYLKKMRKEVGGRVRTNFRREELEFNKAFLIAVTTNMQLGKLIISLSIH